jgi:4-hydroxy-2-oxoheptanedioate aldolase
MIGGISSGGAKSLVRDTGYSDRAGIQQSLDIGAPGSELLPLSDRRHPIRPQRSMNKQGLLDYAGGANDNLIVASRSKPLRASRIG